MPAEILVLENVLPTIFVSSVAHDGLACGSMLSSRAGDHFFVQWSCYVADMDSAPLICEIYPRTIGHGFDKLTGERVIFYDGKPLDRISSEEGLLHIVANKTNFRILTPVEVPVPFFITPLPSMKTYRYQVRVRIDTENMSQFPDVKAKAMIGNQYLGDDLYGSELLDRAMNIPISKGLVTVITLNLQDGDVICVLTLNAIVERNIYDAEIYSVKSIWPKNELISISRTVYWETKRKTWLYERSQQYSVSQPIGEILKFT